MAEILTHLWQEQGLGQSPFRAVCIISIPPKSLCESNIEAYNNAMREASQQARSLGVHLCQCESCGMSLDNNVVIRDATGKHFVVGCDCAGRVNDSELIEEVKLLERRRQAAIREAKRETERLEQVEKRMHLLQEQRDRNGGLTDAEVAERNRIAEEEAARDKYSVENEWLLSVLRREYQGDFVTSMIRQIESSPVSGLPERCSGIVADIYAKSFGRRNSKKYDAAIDDFIARTEESQETAK